MGELHKVLLSFPGYFKSILIELLDGPKSHQEILDYMEQLSMRLGPKHRNKITESDLQKNIASALEQKALVHQQGRYALTPRGREIAEHMQEAIPIFMNAVLSTQMVSAVTIIVHIFLSIFKLGVGLLSRSAGLLADGIDNTVDTISSVLVWLGIKFDRERLVSIFIIVMMFVSAAGIAFESYNKIVSPEPVLNAAAAFSVSAVCGILMLLLSAYQYFIGRRNLSFAIMCQAVDSRNHFLTSLLVCVGILLSILARSASAEWGGWLHYGDGIASAVIGLLIIKSAIGLAVELLKPEGEPTHVSHFVGKTQEKIKSQIIFDWLFSQLEKQPLTESQLEQKFLDVFCEKTPKILILSGVGYRPESAEDLFRHLRMFVEQDKLILSNDLYRLPVS
jgi:Co/Zn/Cd efflux system component